MEKIKKLLLGAGVVVFIIVFALMTLNFNLEHIEDTNGDDVYILQKISDYDIIDMKMGALNVFQADEIFNNLPTFNSKKFTGVYELYTTNTIANRFDITLYNTVVNSGNFKIVLVYNDEIVHEFKLNELSQSFTLKDVNGTVSLRIAGESADFTLSYDLI